jgi:hypothetical protein
MWVFESEYHLPVGAGRPLPNGRLGHDNDCLKIQATTPDNDPFFAPFVLTLLCYFRFPGIIEAPDLRLDRS